MAFSWSVPGDALCCQVCLDYYKDPVLLPCSHSFCKDCVQQCWRAKPARECPVCKTVSSTRTPTRNLVLKNLCEAFQLEMESGVVCRQHNERLKLFCLDHRTPVCVICRESTEHQNHSFTPVDEAAGSHRVDLMVRLRALREKAKLFGELRAKWQQTDSEIESQARETEDSIKGEFEAFHDFLRAEESARLAELRAEEERKRLAVKCQTNTLGKEINAMESTIKTIEGGLKDEDASFLLKVDALTKEAERPLPADPKKFTVALIDVAKHLGNMRFNVWSKMKELVSYTPVILNPNTAHRELCLSRDLTSVTCGPKQPLAVLVQSQPERMHQHRSVLGRKGFTSGSHSWDVDIEMSHVWALGVMAQAAHRSEDKLSGLWMLRFCNGKFTAFAPSCPASVLRLKGGVRRVRVHLDMDKGRLSFSDAETDAVMHTFKHTFNDRMFPYVNTWCNLPLKIVPLPLSVIVG